METDVLPTELRSCVVKVGTNYIKSRFQWKQDLASDGEMSVKLPDFVSSRPIYNNLNLRTDEKCCSMCWNYSSNASASLVGTSRSPAPLLRPNADALELSVGFVGNFARLDSSMVKPFPGVSPNTK